MLMGHWNQRTLCFSRQAHASPEKHSMLPHVSIVEGCVCVSTCFLHMFPPHSNDPLVMFCQPKSQEEGLTLSRIRCVITPWVMD